MGSSSPRQHLASQFSRDLLLQPGLTESVEDLDDRLTLGAGLDSDSHPRRNFASLVPVTIRGMLGHIGCSVAGGGAGAIAGRAVAIRGARPVLRLGQANGAGQKHQGQDQVFHRSVSVLMVPSIHIVDSASMLS